MIMVDTSAWIEALRKNGNPTIKQKIANWLKNDQVRFCDPIVLELKNSQPRSKERKQFNELMSLVPVLPAQESSWKKAGEYAIQLRSQGVSIPAIDLLIRAIADEHGAKCFSLDSDFSLMEKCLNQATGGG